MNEIDDILEVYLICRCVVQFQHQKYEIIDCSGVSFYAGVVEVKVSWFSLFAVNFIQSVYVWNWLSSNANNFRSHSINLESIVWTGPKTKMLCLLGVKFLSDFRHCPVHE